MNNQNFLKYDCKKDKKLFNYYNKNLIPNKKKSIAIKLTKTLPSFEL